MRKVKGEKIDKLDFTPHKLGDLIYHEGPLLSLFGDDEKPGTYYLYKWADCDELTNRWLILTLNTNSLQRFFEKEISLRTIFLSNATVILLELDDTLAERGLLISAVSDLPGEYLPKINSWYSEEKYTTFASAFKNSIADAAPSRQHLSRSAANV